jgi:hypothetical protein
MRRHLVLVMILALVLGVLAAPASGKKGELKDRPFKATADRIEAEPSGDCPTGYEVAEDSTYTGRGTHLGRFTMDETLCLDLDTFEFFVDGTIFAANGDELNFSVGGIFPQSSGWVFEGGTGRFASAEGVAHETLIRDNGGPIIGIEAEGTIRFDASDRSR